MGILWEVSLADFLLVTVIVGGWTAWMTGRAIANTWKPLYVLVFYALLLSLAARFLHFALFHGSLLTAQFWFVDFIILLAAALLGWRYTRTNQMVTQYSWLYERAGPLSWRERTGRSAGASG